MSKTYDTTHSQDTYLSNYEYARTPTIVEKDNQLIRHCRASKYKTGPLVGMRVPLYINRGGTNIDRVLSFVRVPYLGIGKSMMLSS